MNITKNFGLAPYIISNSAVVYAGKNTTGILPYSSMFDLLNYFNDKSLDKKIMAKFTSILPLSDHYKNNIDLWVDLESLGEISCILAKELATTISEYINETSLLRLTYVPCAQKEVTRENQLFFDYLLAANNKVTIFYSKKLSNIEVPDNNTNYLKWEIFAVTEQLDYIKNVETVLNYAWRCAELGAEQVAFKILNHALDGATDSYLNALYLVQLQFMRIATQYYNAAAAEERTIMITGYSDLVQSLYLTKAWGSILSRQVNKAGYYFDLAGITMSSIPQDIDGLYRLNIFALLQHLSGNINNAFKIENKIKTVLATLNEPRPQITYINSINLARLYRHHKDYQQSLQHYDRAFETVKGIKSETDFIYSNVCYGMLYEKQGNFSLALKYWLRASIHWIVTSKQSALGWRAIRAIAQPDFKPRETLLPDKITTALITKLSFLAEINKISIQLEEKINLIFAAYDNQSFSGQACMYGADGLSIIADNNNATIKQSAHNFYRNNSIFYKKLIKIVCALLKHYLGCEFNKFNTIVIDRTNGTEIPQALPETMQSALLLDINQVIYRNKKYILDDRLTNTISNQLIVKPAASILELQTQMGDVSYVKHMRYFHQKILSSKEVEILKLLQLENRFKELQKHIAMDKKDLLALLKRGLIELQLTNFTSQ